MFDLPALIQDAARFGELAHAVQEGAPVQRIREVKLKLTARCNLRCAFCRFWQLPKLEEMATAEVLRLLDDLADLDCGKIHFSGGEATLRPDLVPLIAHAVQRGMRTSLTTNGTRLDEALATALVASGLRSITMSLDSATPAHHDALRGVKGAFKRTLAGLKAIRRAKKAAHAKLNVRLNMVLTRHNYHEYPDVLALAGEIGVSEVTCIPVDEKPHTANRLLPAQLTEYNETIAPAVAALRAQYGFSPAAHLIYPFGQAKDDLRGAAESTYGQGYYRRHLCYAPWLHALVTWEGNVWPCCMLRGRGEPLGNVREQSFRDIFLGEAYSALRQRFTHTRPTPCHRCDDFLAENQVLNAALKLTSDLAS